jgi:hypothetical protein
MDADRFERAVRLLTASPSRRHTLGGLVGLVMGGTLGLAGLGHGTAKGKGGKGKGKGKGGKGKGKKPKGCRSGEKPCGHGCIPASNCCPGESARDCPCNLEQCVNLTCECVAPTIRHNGVCGLPPFNDDGRLCTSNGQPNTGLVEECCSGNRKPGTDPPVCAAGRTRCLSDADCVAGRCLGFVCQEIWRAYDGNCLVRAIP